MTSGLSLCAPQGDSARPAPPVWGASRLLAVLLPALAAGVLHLGFLAKQVIHHRGDLTALVCVDKARAGHFPYERITAPIGAGYDGEYYYALARSPWKRHQVGLDVPGARQLRIFYPALCWLLSGGDAGVLFWVMPGVNLLAIAALAGLGAWLACRHGMSPWLGFLLPLALNPGLAALRNLTDPVSTLALFALLAGWISRARPSVVALCAAAALFSREQNAAVVLLLLMAALWLKRNRTAAGLAVSLLLWGGWVVALRYRYAEWPFLPAQGNFAFPLQGFFFRWAHLAYPSGRTGEAVVHFVAMLGLTMQSVLAGLLLLRARQGERIAPLVALGGAALMALAGMFVYQDIWGYLRVLVWLPLGVWLAGLQARKGWVLLLLTPGIFPTLALLRNG